MTVSLIHPTRRVTITDIDLRDAIAAANETASSNHGASYARWGDDREHGEWAQLPIREYRDEDTLDQSNREVILEDIFGILGDAKDDDYVRESASHWLVGWTAIHLVRVYDDNGQITPVAEKCAEWVNALRNYPVADDDHFSELETKEMDSFIESDGPSMIENADKPVTLRDDLPENWIWKVVNAAWWGEDATSDGPYRVDEFSREHEQDLADAAVKLGFATYDDE